MARWMKDTTQLSITRERELSRIIQERKDAEEGSKEYQEKRDAVNELVGSYAPLIEAISRERSSDIGAYGSSYEDFIAEAYLVSCQSALTFNPPPEGNVRFSSYVSLAITSSLSRMSLRTRSVVYVPASKMAEVRKWSHVYYRILNTGVEPDDDVVSEIAGVECTASDMHSVMGTTFDHPIDNEHNVPQPEKDSVTGMDKDTYSRRIAYAMHHTYGHHVGATMVDYLGLTSGEVKISPFFMNLFNSDFDDKDFFPHIPTLLNHPQYRVRIANYLEGEN